MKVTTAIALTPIILVVAVIVGIPAAMIIEALTARPIVVDTSKVDLSSFDGEIRLSAVSGLENVERYCFLPTGTVVPLGELTHVFQTTDVVISRSYDSDGFWFLAAFDRAERRVYADPFSHHRLPSATDSDHLICGRDLILTRTGAGVHVRSSEAQRADARTRPDHE